MRGSVVYLTGEQLSINAHQKEILLIVIGSAQCRDADQRPVCGVYGQIT